MLYFYRKNNVLIDHPKNDNNCIFEPTNLRLGISQSMCFCMVKFRIKFHQFLLSCLCTSWGWNHHLHNIVVTLDQEAGNIILTQHNNFYTKLPICITLFIFAQRIELIPSSQFTLHQIALILQKAGRPYFCTWNKSKSNIFCTWCKSK